MEYAHIDEIALRVANAAGFKRAGKRIRERVRKVANAGVLNKRLHRSGEFLWLPDHLEAMIRNREGVPQGLQRPEKIAPEEIGSALLHAIRASCGIVEEGAVKEAARLFGYKRVGKDIQSRFRGILKGLIEKGKVKRQRQGDWLVCK